MIKVVTVNEMQAIEREANEKGISYDQMMNNAGHGLSEFIKSQFDGMQNKSIIGLVGSGNNGGDTLVALADLIQSGWTTYAVLFKQRPADDPYLQIYASLGGEFLILDDVNTFEGLDRWIDQSQVLMDGVLGTGIKLPLQGDLPKRLQHVSQKSHLPWVVAVDCPSGLDCDTGEAAPESIRADYTVAMAAVKTGMLTLPAFELLGELIVIDIGLPSSFPSLDSIQRFMVDHALVHSVLPERRLDSHKGTFGTGMIIAGSINYPGAAFLAAKAAYRIGAGLITLAVPGCIQAGLMGNLPEVTWLLLPHQLGVIEASAVDVIYKHIDQTDAVLLGPGINKEKTTLEFVKKFLDHRGPVREKSGIGFIKGDSKPEIEDRNDLPPLIVDADGLNLLAQIPDWPNTLPGGSILTPHPGEMSRLTRLTIKDIQSNRLQIAEDYARKWNQIVVLKGALTIIADPVGKTAFIPVATPSLARAGTGDVLAGIIHGLLTQGLDPFTAGWAGSWIHAHAGLSAMQAVGNPASVIAGDVIDSIAWVMETLMVK